MPITQPPVHYASTADGLEIAYQVLGDGPLDIVIVPGMSGNLDWNAELPFYGGYLRRFPRFARTIVLDRRGAGVSDREVGRGSAEDRMDDVRAVMDAVGCERAALLGQLEGGVIAILFAATYPERVSALVLVETPARRVVRINGLFDRIARYRTSCLPPLAPAVRLDHPYTGTYNRVVNGVVAPPWRVGGAADGTERTSALPASGGGTGRHPVERGGAPQ